MTLPHPGYGANLRIMLRSACWTMAMASTSRKQLQSWIAMYRNPALFRCTGVCSTSSMSCQTLCFYIALLHQRRQFGQNRLRAEAFPCFSCHLRLQSLLRKVCSSFWRVPRVAQLRHRRCSPSPETTVFGRICRHERHSNHPFLARVESRFASSWQSLQARPSTGKVTMLG